MATKVITEKIQHLEMRVTELEQEVKIVQLADKLPNNKGLQLLHGLWSKKPRTKKQLNIVRKQLWQLS